jgi:hypothetical protein
MKKLFLLLFLSFTSLSVYAKWVLVSGSEEARFYVEINSIKQTGKVVTYWELLDYSSMQTWNNLNYFSAKQKYETNCNTEESALLYINYYSENMGSGKSVYAIKLEQKDFQPNIPDTTGHTIYKFVCNKK